jgi:hAT family C-terminal dimerisation region
MYKIIMPECSLQPAQLLGVVMDNTKANLKAMKCLTVEHPTWLAEGCVAHALNLLVKDIGKPKEGGCTGTAELLGKAQRMALVIGDCSTIKELLHKHMKEAYEKVRAISTHAPTRFATMYLVVRDLHQNQQAIMSMCNDDEWTAAAKASTNSDVFTDNANKADFWQQLKLVKELLEPISDAIHQLEADLPLLSQVFDTWKRLRAHFVQFNVQYGKTNPELMSGVMSTFERRYKNHVSPAALAAYLLDPMHAVQVAGTEDAWVLPFSSLPRDVRKKESQDTPSLFESAFETVVRITGANRAKAKAEWDELAMQSAMPDELFHCFQQVVGTKAEDGTVRIVPAALRRGWWKMYASVKYPIMAKASERLLSAHATTAATERNWSAWGHMYSPERNRLQVKTAEKIIYIKCNLDTSARSTEHILDMATLRYKRKKAQDEEDE